MYTSFLLQILNVRLLLVIEWEINSLREVLDIKIVEKVFVRPRSKRSDRPP